MKAGMLGDDPGRVKTSGTLSVVATPIGNLGDLTDRAVKTLQSVDLVVCEDTRRTRALLTHLGISKPLVSLFEHNERDRTDELIASLRAGKHLALVSDAGTPTISDPGFRLVRAARDAALAVVPIPGPSAAMTALSVSGLPSDQFFFAGFPPRTSPSRRAAFEALATLRATIIFYEAPHRFLAMLTDAIQVFGDREAFLMREGTKKHEEYMRASLSHLRMTFESRDEILGEIVLIVGGATGAEAHETDAAVTLESAVEIARAAHKKGASSREAAREAARGTSLSARDVYQAAFAKSKG